MSAPAELGFSGPSPIQSWYLVCRSAAVRPGGVLSREILGRSIVIFRGKSGALSALSAHCAHMGAHLGGGVVVGDHLRCPLHHWEYDGQGVCRRIPGSDAIPEDARQSVYPVAERCQGIFLFNGPAPLFPPPSFSTAAEASLRVAHGPPVHLRCPWYAVGANAFDMQHLQTVHERALREPPSVERLDRHRLRLRYVSRVTGRTGVDRTMRWLSRDRIAVTVTCWGGSVLTIESDLGRSRSALLLAILPTEEGAEVTPIFAVRRSGFIAADALGVAAARWLFSGFLQRDVKIMDGMRFRPRLTLPQDEPLRRYLEFIDDLPATVASRPSCG